MKNSEINVGTRLANALGNVQKYSALTDGKNLTALPSLKKVPGLRKKTIS